jgi:hypothetical protein
MKHLYRYAFGLLLLGLFLLNLAPVAAAERTASVICNGDNFILNWKSTGTNVTSVSVYVDGKLIFSGFPNVGGHGVKGPGTKRFRIVDNQNFLNADITKTCPDGTEISSLMDGRLNFNDIAAVDILYPNGDCGVILYVYNPYTKIGDPRITISDKEIKDAIAKIGTAPFVKLWAGKDGYGRPVELYFVRNDKVLLNGFYPDGKSYQYIYEVPCKVS